MEQTVVQRATSMGLRGASPIDLIAIGFSRREEDANNAESMAREILQRYEKIQGLAHIDADALFAFAGLEPFDAFRTMALLELGRRIERSGQGQVGDVKQPKDVYKMLSYLRDEKQEHFVALLLDTQAKLIKTSTIHKGTLTMSVVGAREIFREAIREGASSVIVAHNHPSGDPTPSPEDVAVTQKLVQVGLMLDIPILDHVIIGNGKYCSFTEAGLLK